MTETEIVEAVRDYEAGATIAALAGKHGVAPATMRTALLAAGTTLRRPGGRRPRGLTGRPRVSAVLPSYGTTPQAAS